MFNLAKSNSSRVVGILGLLMASTVQATVVEVRTVLGNVQINLFDEETPETVENFLDYVNSGAYANTVVHRLEPSFVAQSGGFVYNDAFPFDSVPTGTPVINEPVLSNVRGTIAMAKLASSPNSATSQWFINLSDNSANLDVQNGGFTVFGQVLGNGMEVLDAIEDLPRFNLGGAATSIPLRDYTSADANNDVEVTGDNLVIITDVVVTDGATVTNPDIVPVKNTLLGAGSPDVPDSGNNSSGGGSLGFFLLSLALVCRCIKFKRS
ncbi:peptidylprolyl isomerase [Alteromonas sp. A081]|uniref:peptidylprolyl isomerase n=1 Tax=Alteromonas sp. A081 TaxID=3410269 RepID=UPI003B9832A6